MVTKKHFWIDIFLLALGSALLFGTFLGSYPLTVPDEGRYADIARTMLTSKNYITPHLNGTTFLDKPILFYWIEALFLKLFGINEWAARLLPAICATVGVLVTYWAGIKLYNRRTGLLSAIILATSVFYFILAHYVDMDLMVATLLSITLWLFIVAVQMPINGQRTRLLIAMYSFAALAFLTKGLIGVALPGLIVFTWMLVRHRWYLLKNLHLLKGLFIFLLLILPWCILVQHKNPEFLYYFFIVQQFSRYLTHNFNLQMPLYFYPAIILGGMLPWSLFFIQSFIDLIKKMSRNWQGSDKEVFLLLWPLIIFIFFSIPASKLAGYILPVFAPLSMIVGKYLSDHWHRLKDKISLSLVTGILVLFGPIVITLFSILRPKIPMLATIQHQLYILAGFYCVSSLVILAITLLRKNIKLIFISLTLSVMIIEIGSAALMKHMYINGTKMIAVFLKTQLKPGDEIVAYEDYYFDLPFYLNTPIFVASRTPWNDPSIKENDNWQRELAEDIIYKKGHPQQALLLNEPTLMQQYWNNPSKRVFVLADEGSDNNLFGKPIYQYQGVNVFRNHP